jgi:hypothetical protein
MVVMANPLYDKYESQFLDSVAAELGLVDDHASFFKVRSERRFSERYTTNTQLVKNKEFLKRVYPFDYKEDNLKVLSSQAEEKLKYTFSKKIKPKITKKNWTLDGKEIQDWNAFIAFLRNDYFTLWWEENKDLLTNPWEQLWEKVNSFEGITIKAKTVPTLEFDGSAWGEEEEEIPTFTWNKELKYEIKSQQVGYLTLIQKYASGKLKLLSPSFLVSQPHQPSQMHRFPSAKFIFLPLKAGIMGEDWIVAIISQEKPSFSWVKVEEQKPLDLKESDLQEVLNFINQEPNCEIIGTKLRIKAPA